ncbi:ABC transporter permease [Ornithinimicrobium cerasi]|uniref:Iron(III) transport system permease protein n=1 Tax=Ornithinimicrobium cerasi TaxID=2248773 RepID=A0A285VVD2_9MICO|nr:iron ABC transporter permease [Ornithinimicrobium cerasi]SOC57206.1 iron(III) transport system permease protein [Ornithinimicrobium cerasi]
MATAVALIPLVYLVLRTGQGGLGAWLETVATERTARLATTSLLLAVVVTAACLLIGVGAAWLVTRSNTPGRRALAVLMALPLAVPSYVAAFTWVSVADLWTTDPGTRFEGFVAASVVLTLYTYPYVYLPVAVALVRVDPAQEEVARSLGRGPLHTLLTVTLPQVRPAIAGGALLAVLYVLADFGAVSILRLDTFTRAVFTAFSAGFNRQGALTLATLLVLVTVLVLTVEGRTRRAGARFSGTHVTRPARAADLGVWRWAGSAALAAVLLAALGVPALSLVRWMTSGTSGADAVGRLWDAAAGSLTASLLGALLTMLLALPVGILAARHPGRLSRALERGAYLAHSLPGVVVGLSLVFFGVTVALPLYQTTWLLALGYATLFLPLGVGAVASAAAQAPPSLEEAASALGRSPAEVFRRVTLPLTLPGIGAGAALVFLTAMKELPATLLLRPTGMDTLATRLWSATAIGRYAEAAPYALVLVALAAVPTWLIVRRSGILPAAGEREPLRPVRIDETVATDLLEGVKA